MIGLSIYVLTFCHDCCPLRYAVCAIDISSRLLKLCHCVTYIYLFFFFFFFSLVFFLLVTSPPHTASMWLCRLRVRCRCLSIFWLWLSFWFQCERQNDVRAFYISLARWHFINILAFECAIPFQFVDRKFIWIKARFSSFLFFFFSPQIACF